MHWLKITLSPLCLLGEASRRAVRYLAALSIFGYLPVMRTLLPPYSGIGSIRRTVVMQVYFTGVQALGLFLFLGVLSGLSLTFLPVPAEGIKAMICNLILKGVAPLLVAFIIIGRSGTAITVELGNMTVLGEIRQLRIMGIDPFRHVIFPRLAGVTLATFFMIFFFCGAILVVAAAFATEPPPVFIKEVLNDWTVPDVVILMEKGILFGFIISMVACYQGLNLTPATTEVPKATIRTVIQSIVLCASASFLFRIAGL